jgi:hypothetical protein
MEKCFETTIFVKIAILGAPDKVPMGTQWGLTEKESVNKAMFEFDMYAKHSDFGVEDVVSIETIEI